MAKKEITFAIVGYGHIGKRHASMVSGNDEGKVVGVVEPMDDRRADAEATEGVKAFKTIAELYEAGVTPDIINICTPNGLHAKLALEALEKRAHVVIEKPMGLTKQESEEVIYRALQVSKQVFLVKQNRYSPTSVWLKSIIDEGRLGKVFMVQLNCYWNRDNRYYKPGGWKGTLNMDGGTLFTQFIASSNPFSIEY